MVIHIISKQTMQYRRNITIHVHDDITNNIGTETYIVSSIPVRRKTTMARSSNKLLVPGVEQYLDQVKYEIAQEFGVTLGSDTVARSNGSVGGEITKRLVKQAQSQLTGQQTK